MPVFCCTSVDEPEEEEEEDAVRATGSCSSYGSGNLSGLASCSAFSTKRSAASMMAAEGVTILEDECF